MGSGGSPPLSDAGSAAPIASEAGQTDELSDAPWPAEEFWLQVAPGGMALERYDALDAMTTAADAVVVGHAQKVVPGRPISEPAYGMGFATLLFAVDEVLAGTLHEPGIDVMNIEFFMSDARLLERFMAGVPDERVVLFVRNKAAEASGEGRDPDGPLAGRDHYRIVGPQGFLREVGGKVEPPVGAEDDWLVALKGADFATELRAIAETGSAQ